MLSTERGKELVVFLKITCEPANLPNFFFPHVVIVYICVVFSNVLSI